MCFSSLLVEGALVSSSLFKCVIGSLRDLEKIVREILSGIVCVPFTFGIIDEDGVFLFPDSFGIELRYHRSFVYNENFWRGGRVV